MDDDFQSDIVDGYEETVFVNEEGVTYTIIYNEKEPDVKKVSENETDLNHIHKYIDVTIEEHKKYSDGSCVTRYYDGQECTSCGKVLKGDKIGELTMEKCPH